MKPIETQFVLCIKKDEHAHRETNTQSQNFYDGKYFITPQIAESRF
jgi:hypothetical protein